MSKVSAQNSDQPLDDLVVNLDQAEAVLSAIIDQAVLNGPDVVKPAALIAAHNLLHNARAAARSMVKNISSGGAQ